MMEVKIPRTFAEIRTTVVNCQAVNSCRAKNDTLFTIQKSRDCKSLSPMLSFMPIRSIAEGKV
jgi:hypothetical protein